MKRRFPLSSRSSIGLSALIGCGVLSGAALLPGINPPAVAQNTPALLEFRWDSDNDGYRKLYYVQSSSRRRDRSEYYFMLRKKDRKTAILKLSITVPNYFNTRIRPEALSLCKMSMGGMLSRSKCKEVLPAVFEVNEKQTAIEVFPDTPIPTGGTYAVVMNVFNPSDPGMFQFNALAQAPGDVPVSGYIGSWLVDID
ncbi:DUF2808 domain-containing protein [Synechococcus sp. MIT S9503]|uniref:DUF2808 domain-containing protein n=1 Tax=Synechococcus sp. MIT S9503 TaxID=3082547 RepID=UPI0039A67A4C|tara:strand:+ start:826 stop:1416 length:591 start_codon:yes stop_codon:yes gene_type:complete